MRAITPMKDDLARKIRATAASVDKTHPETVAAQHLRNAATLVQHGQGDGAKRHLDAAMELMTPRNLMRHGITDDEGHATAKTAMHQMNVHRLGVMDIQDAQARNSKEADAKKQASDQQTAAKQAAAAAKQQATTPPPPASGTGQQNSGPGQQSQPPASPPGKQPAGGNQQGQQASAASNTWPTPILAQSFSNVDLSARTAALEVTPAPYGKPGGPGLYGKAGNKHSDYFEQIVTALMTKRGMDKATASKIAWGALRKWRAGGGGVHPEVQAAAAGALGKEAAAGARAALANSGSAVELSWKDAWKTEDRGKGGQWVGELSGAVRDLAGKTGNSEADDHLRKAADAIGAQDKATAQQHLKAADDLISASMRGHGTSTDAGHRQGNAALMRIRQHMRGTGDLPDTKPAQLSGGWDTIDRLIDLAAAQQGGSGARSQNAKNQARVPKGQPGGGQFGTGGKGKAAKGKAGKGSGSHAAQKKALLAKAATIRGQIKALAAQIKSANSTAAKSPAAAAAAAKSAASTAAAAPASTAAPAASSTTTAKAASTPTVAQMTTQMTALRGQLAKVMAQIHQLANDDRAAIELAARNGVHIPGTSYDWRHTWIPLTGAAAQSHFSGHVPASWKPKAGSLSTGEDKGKGTAVDTGRVGSAPVTSAEARKASSKLKSGQEIVHAEGEHQGVHWQQISRVPPGVIGPVLSTRLTYGGSTLQTQGYDPIGAAGKFKAEEDARPAKQAAAQQAQERGLSESISMQLGRDRQHTQLNPLTATEAVDAYKAGHNGYIPPAVYRRLNASGVTEAEHNSDWYQAALQGKADAGHLLPSETQPGALKGGLPVTPGLPRPERPSAAGPFGAPKAVAPAEPAPRASTPTPAVPKATRNKLPTFKHPQTAAKVRQARTAANAGNLDASERLLQEADSLEAHEGVDAATGTRKQIAATIAMVRRVRSRRAS